ncbi:hypothetical protein GA0070607_0201 [Micromonospora coriariae]|uniref:Uncharacterized protein n=1 Tax=Micromonospora coriariae TaxID=285665 RepID=A0A1C4U5Z0_9ACTN|nr:hypothetical protein [Micromonospora coriariae]SCE67135.1 hypothetical protein GA0070607_0201 [Micromonospora coriariae]
MDLFKREDLLRLADDSGGVRVSMFLPTHRGGPQSDRNRIRLKNLVRHAQQVLRHEGTPGTEVDAILAPARDLLHRVWLWQRPSDGLALFLSAGSLQPVRVPIRLPELVTVGDRFAVRPLLSLLTAGGHFYILALNQEEIRLFRGSRFDVDEVTLDGLPLAMWLTMPRRQPMRAHAFLVDRAGDPRAGFNGNDADSAPLIIEHLRRVDRALTKVLDDEDAPLLLAGVRSTQQLYRQVNTHPRLLDTGIDGGPWDLSAAQLHRRAWPLVEPTLRKDEVAAVAAYRALLGTDRTHTEPAEILAFAEQGRIETLFLCADRACGDASLPAGPSVRHTSVSFHKEHLDLAAVATLRHGGAVYTVSRSRMPDVTSAAAMLRY